MKKATIHWESLSATASPRKDVLHCPGPTQLLPNCLTGKNSLDQAHVVFKHFTLGRTSKVTPPPWYKEGGDGVPLGFRYVTIFRKDLTFSRKPMKCSTR